MYSPSPVLGPDFVYRNTSFYTADALVNVVACAEQHQFRNPMTGSTGRLGGLELFANELAELGFNDNQKTLYNRSFFIGQRTVLTHTVTALESALLLASDRKFYGDSMPLPDNQWQLEFNHYFGVGLNTLQLWTQQYVSGTAQPELNKYVVPATEGFEKQMCTSQVTRRDDYRSFSVLGLAIIIVFTLLFLFLNLTIGPIVVYVKGHTAGGRYGNAEWQANDFLQLQRMAYEHKNIGNWKGHNDMVPRTDPGEVFTIPHIDKLEESVAGSRSRQGSTVLRLWSRGASHKADDPKIHVTDASDSSVKQMSVTHAEDVEKDMQVSEVQVRA